MLNSLVSRSAPRSQSFLEGHDYQIPIENNYYCLMWDNNDVKSHSLEVWLRRCLVGIFSPSSIQRWNNSAPIHEIDFRKLFKFQNWIYSSFLGMKQYVFGALARSHLFSIAGAVMSILTFRITFSKLLFFPKRHGVFFRLLFWNVYLHPLSYITTLEREQYDMPKKNCYHQIMFLKT